MRALVRMLAAVVRNESGTAFLEYTYLLGILLSISLAVLVAVSEYAAGMWTALCSIMLAIPGTSIEACTPA